MDILKLIESVPDYMNESADNIIIFQSIKYYRNLEGLNFTSKLSADDLKEIKKKILNNVTSLPLWENNYKIIESEQAPQELLLILYERGIAGQETIQTRNSTLIFGDDERFILRIGERDHLKFIVNSEFNQLDEMVQESQIYIGILDKILRFAYKEGLGYLTSSPRYLGHALNFSAMCHIPAIFALGQIQAFSQILQKYLIVLAGIMDSSLQTYGAFVQLKITSFLDTVEEVKNKMKSALDEIRDLENQMRNIISLERPIEIEDRIYKSYAILQNSKLLNIAEAFENLSNLRLGVELGYIKEIHPSFFDKVFFRILPNHIRVFYAVQEDDLTKEAEMRALLVQELLEKYYYAG
ncbi:MAG TPA: hypothetical protein PKU94_01930 [Candidatus Hydrothermia bacterium]|nr:hypothetical protein [Candidatus Hydrothermae bacterium]MDD3649092.1 hypothetical protein [Candidatus Hydrothermia bacterium]MDD5572917.1 hypothetical protein [Candidatus Hydrothermia bacterium]HOK23031.1 hypothetical protein [Candidatus Hydrothermia bacterium]HOL23709.1 hypothetical protein [Candidatus Hydrothermia bacterium]